MYAIYHNIFYTIYLYCHASTCHKYITSCEKLHSLNMQNSKNTSHILTGTQGSS